jgi:hypothetical protein
MRGMSYELTQNVEGRFEVGISLFTISDIKMTPLAAFQNDWK